MKDLLAKVFLGNLQRLAAFLQGFNFTLELFLRCDRDSDPGFPIFLAREGDIGEVHSSVLPNLQHDLLEAVNHLLQAQFVLMHQTNGHFWQLLLLWLQGLD